MAERKRTELFTDKFQVQGPLGSFDMEFSPSLTLTPDPANYDIARLVGERAVASGRGELRVLEPGIGAGAFPVTLMWQHPGVVGEVVGTDTNRLALEMAEHNLRNAGIRSGKMPDVLLLDRDWLDGVQGQFDVIYFNPPFFTPEVIPPTRCMDNPRDAMYPPNLTYHYDQVIKGVAEHIRPKTTFIVRTPRMTFKAQQIWGTARQYLNFNQFTVEDVSYPEGRFLYMTAK